MVKFLITCLMSLGILLVSGYQQLHANKHEDKACYSSFQTQNASFASFSTELATLQKSTSSASKKTKHQLEVAEIIEEDDLIPFKSFLEGNNLFPVIFYALLYGFLGFLISNVVPFVEERIAFSSSKRYIMFRVFRI